MPAIWNFSFIEVTSRKYVTRLSNRGHLGGLADAAKELHPLCGGFFVLPASLLRLK
jgi:hypothetical protein